MSAIDELRKLLDERGVEYVANHRQTWWKFGTGGHAFAVNDGPTLCVALTGATPAQAIEATLGRGETEREENAELRELVRDIADHIKHGDGFGIDRGWMLDRIRELGVEVDE